MVSFAHNDDRVLGVDRDCLEPRREALHMAPKRDSFHALRDIPRWRSLDVSRIISSGKVGRGRRAGGRHCRGLRGLEVDGRHQLDSDQLDRDVGVRLR